MNQTMIEFEFVLLSGGCLSNLPSDETTWRIALALAGANLENTPANAPYFASRKT
jgi:hypothetical protein